jgi:hypothetical protein
MGAKKRNNTKTNTRVLFIELSVMTGHEPAFERTDAFAFDRALHVRPQITATAQAGSDGLLGPARATA